MVNCEGNVTSALNLSDFQTKFLVERTVSSVSKGECLLIGRSEVQASVQTFFVLKVVIQTLYSKGR